MNVFLDLDGTLTNPFLGASRSIGYALEKIGLTVPDLDTLGWVIGPSLLDSFEKLGAPDPELALGFFRERYGTIGLLENEVYPGVPEMLGTLVNSGANLYLATAKPIEFARRITSHFGLSKYFSDEFGPEMDGTRNDKRDLLRYAIEKTGADPSASVMVGDRKHDFGAAKHVGMASVAVTWGFGCEEEYCQADAICNNPDELHDLIADILKP